MGRRRPHQLVVKRVYDPPDPGDGARILVDRLWPRGLSRDKVALDDWLPDVAPSTSLRRWYGHDPVRFAEFAERYRRELDDAQHAAALTKLVAHLAAEPVVTLLTATRDLAHGHTVVLADVLTHREGSSVPEYGSPAQGQ
jgi:uncharacterized protein YeaO (DUF488 family)